MSEILKNHVLEKAKKVFIDLGPFHDFKIYQEALAISLEIRPENFNKKFNIEYKGNILGHCTVDIVMEEACVLVSTLDKISQKLIRECYRNSNFLKIPCILVNFKSDGPYIDVYNF
jgi:hypothetical protein